jgi:putative ABC transport system substrate-binding protein
MERRQFVGLVSGGLLAGPFAAHAQTTIPVIGYLSGRSADSEAPIREPFLKALADAGFVAGKNITIEYHYTQGRDDRLPELAAEIVRRRVAVIVATSNTAAVAVKAATSTIPIVFSGGADPVRSGLVSSFNRPGGNATGVHIFTTRLGAKRLSLIRAALPKPGLIALVVDPNSLTTESQVEEMQQVADSMSQPLVVLRVTNVDEIDAAFSTMARQRVSAVLYGAAVLFQVVNDRLVELAAQHRIPAFYEWREAVLAGGLMSYNSNRTESSTLLGRYVARILKGAKPADLPVAQSSTFWFAINLKTATALGLNIPAALLGQADEVIE